MAVHILGHTTVWIDFDHRLYRLDRRGNVTARQEEWNEGGCKHGDTFHLDPLFRYRAVIEKAAAVSVGSIQ
jgi:hypothetical protein